MSGVSVPQLCYVTVTPNLESGSQHPTSGPASRPKTHWQVLPLSFDSLLLQIVSSDRIGCDWSRCRRWPGPSRGCLDVSTRRYSLRSQALQRYLPDVDGRMTYNPNCFGVSFAVTQHSGSCLLEKLDSCRRSSSRSAASWLSRSHPNIICAYFSS